MPATALHLRGRLQVLECLRFIDEQVIDAQFIEDEPIILLVLGEQLLQSYFAGGLLLLDHLDEIAVRPGRVGAGDFAKQVLVCLNLLPEKLLLVRQPTCRSAQRSYASR